MSKTPKPLQAEIKKLRRQIVLLYEVGNLMRVTLKIDEIIFLILSAITSHEGLGFNRAMLFLTDFKEKQLNGCFGVGPLEPRESENAWKDIAEKRLRLDGFIDVYRKARGTIDPKLNTLIRSIHMPLDSKNNVLARVAVSGKAQTRLSSSEPALKDALLERFNIGPFVALPIKGKHNVLGTLIVDNPATRKSIQKDEVLNLRMLADHAGLAIENASSFAQVLETSQRDSLTGLWNHAHFQKLLQQSISLSHLKHHPLSLIIFDVDDFKQLNDQLGHQEGDHALREIAHITMTVLRKNDTVARYGGEEFAVIFPGLNKSEAIQLSEKLRNAVRERSRRFLKRQSIQQVTISVGVSTYPEDADDREKLIYCADAALYEAKRAGKNRTQCYQMH